MQPVSDRADFILSESSCVLDKALQHSRHSLSACDNTGDKFDKRRLGLNAIFGNDGAPGTVGMDDETSTRLTDSVQRDYFTLRTRINTISGQVNYIRNQCLR
ncbi:lysis system i-spanin subunit Rz [Kosakonia oryzendophytica]|uniref:lysis system i-spanin subunit Rz n=1 Tax=Kosakonia oryzendophytica TaxID=1005665 RepID=UPI003D349336